MLFNKNKTKENMTMDEENKMVELTDEQLKQVNGGGNPGEQPHCYCSVSSDGQLHLDDNFFINLGCMRCSWRDTCKLFEEYL